MEIEEGDEVEDVEMSIRIKIMMRRGGGEG